MSDKIGRVLYILLVAAITTQIVDRVLRMLNIYSFGLFLIIILALVLPIDRFITGRI